MEQNEDTKLENTPTSTSIADGTDKTESEESTEVKTSEESTEPQGADSSSGEAKTEGDKSKKVQSPEENARFAQMRRENERLRKELESARSEIKGNVSDSTLEALGLTRDDLEDSDNYELAKNYTKALASGEQNPVAYAYKALRKATKEKNEANEKAQKAANKDVADFARDYPDTNVMDVVKDKEFMDLFGDVPDFKGNLAKYYGKYLAIKEMNKPTPKPVSNTAKAVANPSVQGGSTNQGTQSLHDKLSKMSDAELDAWYRSQRRR